MILAFFKPYGVISQFTEEVPGQKTLALFGFPKRVYPVGRLDADSEGLLILSDEKWLPGRLLPPWRRHPREYWAQVEGIPSDQALEQLARGVVIQGRRTLPCRVWRIDPPPIEDPATQAVWDDRQPPLIPPRDPPIRFRKSVPTCWIGLELVEGKNRQVRRMTAAVGHPTLRLLRVRIGRFRLTGIPIGTWRRLTSEEIRILLAS